MTAEGTSRYLDITLIPCEYASAHKVVYDTPKSIYTIRSYSSIGMKYFNIP